MTNMYLQEMQHFVDLIDFLITLTFLFSGLFSYDPFLKEMIYNY